nr:hypothetical protein GCM10010200_110870 [Actinomadura rugatobispora]
MAVILGPVISGLAGRIPDLIGFELRNRGVVGAAEEERRLIEIAERRDAAAREIQAREEHERRMLLERYRHRGEHYPLGVIGRLAEKISDGRPAVLVAPVSWHGLPAGRLPGLIHEALREVAGFSRYAELHTGAFVGDRTIRGSVGAAEISALEFPAHPAIVVWFEADGSDISAFAHLGSLFPAVDGAAGFPIRIARFGTGPGRPTRPDGGSLPTWQHIDLSEAGQPAEKVIAAAVAWFVLTCLEYHWQLRGFAGADLRGSVLAGRAPADAPADPPAGDAEPGTGGDVFGCRLEMELRELERRGFDHETAEFGDTRVALIVSDQDLELAFVLAPDYPLSPPMVFHVAGALRERMEIDAADWSAERTLLEIAEGFR